MPFCYLFDEVRQFQHEVYLIFHENVLGCRSAVILKNLEKLSPLLPLPPHQSLQLYFCHLFQILQLKVQTRGRLSTLCL